MAYDSIYITGWEFNRLLVNDPTEPMQSSLPGSVLWEGGAQFWLFKNAYCSKESLKWEIRGSEVMGWAQGRIFRELQGAGFLEPFDWQTLGNANSAESRRLVAVHASLRQQYDRNALIKLLAHGNVSELEAIKLQLVSPVLNHLKCIADVSPGGLAHWMRKTMSRGKAQNPAQHLIGAIAQPVLKSEFPVRAGIALCSRPGSKVSMQDFAAQTEIETTIEKPQIPALFAGDLAFDDYWKTLLPHRNVYEPVSEQLWHEWVLNFDKLKRLRDLAEKYIWTDLHNDWLPTLEQDPSFLPKFQKLLRDALIRAKVGDYFEMLTHVAITAIACKVGVVGAVLSSSVAAGTALGAETKHVLSEALKKRIDETENLRLFYQSAQSLKETLSPPNRSD